VLTLARFSEAFLVLRAADAGLATRHVPVMLVVMAGVYAAFAYPAGIAADRIGRRAMLLSGLLPLLASQLVLASANSVEAALAGSALWGLHMALTRGLLAKLVADAAPAPARGAAFGIFHMTTGVAVLLANVVAGALWTALSPGATFRAGAAFTLVAVAGLIADGWRSRVPGGTRA
jgi:MFS family permease